MKIFQGLTIPLVSVTITVIPAFVRFVAAGSRINYYFIRLLLNAVQVPDIVVNPVIQ